MRKKDIDRLVQNCSDDTFIDQVKSLADTYGLTTTFLLTDDEMAGNKKLLDENVEKL